MASAGADGALRKAAAPEPLTSAGRCGVVALKGIASIRPSFHPTRCRPVYCRLCRRLLCARSRRRTIAGSSVCESNRKASGCSSCGSQTALEDWHMRWSDNGLHRGSTLALALVAALSAATVCSISAPIDAPATQETNKALEPRALLRGNHSTIRAMAFASDNKSLATGTEEGTVRLWDIAPAGGGRERAVLPMPKDCGSILTVAFAADGKSLVTGAAKGEVIVWDLEAIKPRATAKISSLASARFSPDGRFVLVARGELADSEEDLDHVQLLDAATLKKQHVIDVDFEYVFDAIFSPDGATIAISGGESLTPTPASRGGQQRCAIELWTLKSDGTSTKGKRFSAADESRPLRAPSFSGGG